MKSKLISQRSEHLAIKGGRPLFAEPQHVGRPNVGDSSKYLGLINEILDRRWLTNDGPLVKQFEAEIAKYLGVKHVVVMCNGTIALEIAIRSAGLTGEVVVPSYTFIATAHAVSWQGLTPVFADIDPNTHCLDPLSVERAITPRTTGVIATHLWGHPAAIDDLSRICDAYGLRLIFDAAHAFGVRHRGKMVGNYGACEVFSFHATKFLNSFEGGAIVTSDDGLAERARHMRNFGFLGFDNVGHLGTNGKMVEACAAMGLVNLEAIDRFIEVNQKNFSLYASYIRQIPGLKLFRPDAEQTNWQYIVLTIEEEFGPTRDETIAALHAENVLARKYFWPGCHAMRPYRELYPWVHSLLPITNDVAERVVVLPTGTSIGDEAVEGICSVLYTLHTGNR